MPPAACVLLLTPCNWFQGRIAIPGSKAALTVLGIQALQHECIRDGENGEYRVTVVHPIERREITVTVRRSGGELVALDPVTSGGSNAPTLAFQTTKLLSGDGAAQMAKRCFPQAYHAFEATEKGSFECTIAIGSTTLSGFHWHRAAQVQSMDTHVNAKEILARKLGRAGPPNRAPLMRLCEDDFCVEAGKRRKTLAIQNTGGWVQTKRATLRKQRQSVGKLAEAGIGLGVASSRELSLSAAV
jgi:hypothetical protein